MQSPCHLSRRTKARAGAHKVHEIRCFVIALSAAMMPNNHEIVRGERLSRRNVDSITSIETGHRRNVSRRATTLPRRGGVGRYLSCDGDRQDICSHVCLRPELLWRKMLEHVVSVLLQPLNVLVRVRGEILAVLATPKQLLSMSVEDIDNNADNLRNLGGSCGKTGSSESTPAPAAARSCFALGTSRPGIGCDFT